MIFTPPSRLSGRPPRSGFTLIELLVVVAIIIALISLSLGATFQIMAGQRKSNSEQTVKSVATALQRQWKAALDDAKSNSGIPQGVQNMAADGNGSNQARARVIWIKLLMKKEFPTYYWEALNPSGPQNPGSPYNISPTELPPKDQYLQGLQGPLQAGLVNPNSPGPTESGACLYLILKNARRGETFDPDSLGPQFVRDTNNDGVKEIVDGWGTPLGFYRYPVSMTELDGSYTPNTLQQQTFRDPLDPTGTLQNYNWYTANPNGVAAFMQLVHPLGINTGAGTIQSVYMEPAVASFGKDLSSGMAGPGTPPFVLYGADPMLVVNVNQAGDNIYSFRLRQGARGD